MPTGSASNHYGVVQMATRTKTPTTETPKADANPMPSLTPEALASLIGQLTTQGEEIKRLQAALTSKPEKAAANGKSEQSTKNDLAAIRAFKKAGYGTLVPHKDIMTFNKWVELGFRPSEGSHSLKVGNLRLFCKAQCRPMTKDDTAKLKAAHEARKGNAAKEPKAGVTQLHPQQ